MHQAKKNLKVMSKIKKGYNSFYNREKKRIQNKRRSGDIEHRKVRNLDDLSNWSRSYVNVLRSIVEKFMIPLRGVLANGSASFTSDDIKIIFSEIETIYNIHIQLLAGLENCLKDWNESSKLSLVFLKIVS